MCNQASDTDSDKVWIATGFQFRFCFLIFIHIQSPPCEISRTITDSHHYNGVQKPATLFFTYFEKSSE